MIRRASPDGTPPSRAPGRARPNRAAPPRRMALVQPEDDSQRAVDGAQLGRVQPARVLAEPGLRDYIARAVEAQSSIRSRLAPSAGESNPRQLAVLSDAARDPLRGFTAREIALRFAVTTQTGRNDLDDLHQRGFLERRQVGHRHVWTASQALSS